MHTIARCGEALDILNDADAASCLGGEALQEAAARLERLQGEISGSA